MCRGGVAGICRLIYLMGILSQTLSVGQEHSRRFVQA
jgi:hypothetical protein